MPLLRVRAQPFGVLGDHLDGRRGIVPATRQTNLAASRLPRRDRHHHQEDRHGSILHARQHSSSPR